MKHTISIFARLLLFLGPLALLMSSCDPQQTIPTRRCGTMIGYDARLESDPQFAANEKDLEVEISRYIERMQQADRIAFRSGHVVIPVVVHVVHENSTENISDAQIQSQIDVLNEDYRRLNADASGVPSDFSSLVADARIEFVLAQRDPNCNPTTGITRTSTTETSFDQDPYAATATARNPVKFSSTGGADGWPSDQYLNMWVCDLSSGLLGYASFPSDLASRPDEDGVVIDYQYFGTTGTATSPYDLGRTATHEIGHWLNLWHIWGGETPSCSDTDHVGDTPNQNFYNGGCPTHPETSCSSDDMFMNYMDYVNDDCMIMFSDGQSDRMDAVLYTTRTGIVSSQADVPPPAVTQDLYSRDMMDDLGEEPNITSSHMYRSDDIWVRNTNDGFTNQEHQNPIGSSTNYVYVRVRNRGCATANSANVKLYWAKASSGLSWPAPWDGSVSTPALMGDMIGQQPSGSVAASDFVILEYAWTAPNPGDYSSFGADRTHFCLLSRIETSTSAPFGMTTPETSNLGDNVRNNNNIVWKNVSVSEPTSGGRLSGSALISNYTKRNASYRLMFEAVKGEPNIFDFGEVRIKLGKRVARIWENTGMNGQGIEVVDQQDVILLKSGAFLEPLPLKPMRSGVIDVFFKPDPKRLQYGRYVFRLEMQQYDAKTNQFIGGQTFVFKVGK